MIPDGFGYALIWLGVCGWTLSKKKN